MHNQKLDSETKSTALFRVRVERWVEILFTDVFQQTSEGGYRVWYTVSATRRLPHVHTCNLATNA